MVGSRDVVSTCPAALIDRLANLIQYGAKVVIPILQVRARLQHRAGVRSQPTSSIAPKLAKLASTIGNARSLWGLWGTCFRFLASILLKPQSISTKRDVTHHPVAHCPHAPPFTRRLLTIERTQGWSILAFFPLQQLSFLRTNDLVPAALPLPTPSRMPPGMTINDGAVSLWSMRLWMAYVVLQLAHLHEGRVLLDKRQRALKTVAAGARELARRWDAWYNELAVNLSYLLMTIHWSALYLFYFCVLTPLTKRKP